MDSKVEYFGLRFDDDNLTLSIDGDCERLEHASFLDEKFEKQCLYIASESSFPLLSQINLFEKTRLWCIQYLSPRRTCAEDGMDKYSPATEAIEYHDVVFKRDFGSERRFFSDYAGWPSDELDQRWDELYYREFTAIDAESHEHLLNKSVHTPVEGFKNTYMVTLDLFHELHRLNMIRKYFYPKSYGMSLFEEDGETVSYKNWIHLDHCIDTIRQSLMCNADISSQGYDWFEELHYMRVRIDTVHRCRNFDKIRDWAWERSVPWNSDMNHVDEKTGKIVNYGFLPDPNFVHEFTPEEFRHTKEEM